VQQRNNRRTLDIVGAHPADAGYTAGERAELIGKLCRVLKVDLPPVGYGRHRWERATVVGDDINGSFEHDHVVQNVPAL